LGGSSPNELTEVSGELYFQATDGSLGYELFRSDGTYTGTVMVRDIHLGPDSSWPRYLTRVGNRLFFQADDGAHGVELWALLAGLDTVYRVYLPTVCRDK
jgi:ELWxxDGT repeat protein